MNFKTQKIEASYIWMIDIWTYKIRVWICKIFNRDVELIGYGEKRQDTEDIDLQEIINLSNVCENIKEAIEKAEIDAKRKISDFMINLPTSNLFFESGKINYIRKNKKEELDEKESYEILKEIETKIFRNHYKRIKNTTGYEKNDLRLIISHLSKIWIDQKPTKSLVKKTWEEISISCLNIFITENKHNLKNYIWSYINKNILRIIPSEFALIELFNNKKSIVIIDIWNSHTSVIVKKDSEIIWAKKLVFGINDLIKRIRQENKITRNSIIAKIEKDEFLEEKKEFLEIFEDILIITLEDILKYEICPNDFFMIGWWANKFVKKYVENINLHKYNLRMLKKINFVNPKIDFLDDKITENPTWIDEVKSNINIFAMVKATLNFIKKDKSKLERTIKKIIDEIV